MKRLSVFFVTILALVVAPLVHAEPIQLTDQQIVSIRLGCTSALQGIKQVQETEAASRVNRGRAYERTLRLLSALNSRVALSKLDAPVLTSTTARIQQRLTDFQEHYIDYANKMDDVLGTKCTEAPVTFYDKLTTAREARARIAEDINEVDALLDQYQTAVNELKTTIADLEKGVTQ
jgi:chromosome segregation ATPase